MPIGWFRYIRFLNYASTLQMLRQHPPHPLEMPTTMDIIQNDKFNNLPKINSSNLRHPMLDMPPLHKILLRLKNKMLFHLIFTFIHHYNMLFIYMVFRSCLLNFCCCFLFLKLGRYCWLVCFTYCVLYCVVNLCLWEWV